MKSHALAVVLSCALAVPVTAQDPAWKLTPPQVKQIVDRVRAGKSLKPASWPNGARVVVMLSFDVDNETPTLAGGRGGPAAASIGELSRGEYGARVGLQRVLDAVDRNQVPATFFIPAVSLELHPEMATAIKKSGRHEFAVHGWIHEQNTALAPEEETELVRRARDTLERLTGQRPVGYRAPSWNFSQNTLRMLRELGFLYDSSLMSDDHPYELLEDNQATGIVELPVEWILTESVVFEPRGSNYSSPRDVLQVYIDEFDRAWEERGMFILTTHPHIVGHRSRIIVIEKLIEHMKAKGGVWFATQRQAAEYIKQQAGR
jgi:peptidoglycan/xylan/chitin deacetylase (PgdA/CDA1 family)